MTLDAERRAQPPSVLFLFPAEWLPRREWEWRPLADAAVNAGFDAVVATWESTVGADGVASCETAMVQHAGGAEMASMADVRVSPSVVMTTWGVVDWEQRRVFDELVARGALHTEFSVVQEVDGKCELELCLRRFETMTGRTVPRPHTTLSDEVGEAHAQPGDQLVIVKPSRSGQCKGIEILPRRALLERAAAARRDDDAPFVAQPLVDHVYLYEGRRWDLRVHALATSLDPVRYVLYREGVAKTVGAPATDDGADLDEWLNAESRLSHLHVAENLPLSRMLEYVAERHHPLESFWDRLDAVIGDVFEAIAFAAHDRGVPLGRAFLYPGFDFIVERRGVSDYELRLLELNCNPGLGWSPDITAALLPTYRALFDDLATRANDRP